MDEVYNYENVNDRVWFSWNNEPECRKGLDAEKKYLGIFNGASQEPLFINEEGSNWPEDKLLTYTINLRAMWA